MCGVPLDSWVGVVVLNFSGGALQWLQSTRAHETCRNWEEFVRAVCAKFGKEEFQTLIRQFNRLQQTGSVVEYAEKFNGIMHSLHAHHRSWSHLFFLLNLLMGCEQRSELLLFYIDLSNWILR